MTTEKKWSFIINVVYYVIVLAIMFIAIKYGLTWFLPFVIGLLVASILNPIINFISRTVKMNRKLTAIVIVLLFYSTVGVLITIFGAKIFIELKAIFIRLPDIYVSSIEPLFYMALENIENMIGKLDPEMVQGIQDMSANLLSSFGSIISSVSSGVIGFISSKISSLPAFFIAVIFSIIASFFFAMDYKKIEEFVMRQFSPKTREVILDIKEYIGGTLFKFIKAYAILITVTFVELSIGLSILKVDNAISIAFIISVFDIMPVLGTGGVVIPWILIEFIKGNITFAIGLSILYVVVTVIRNIIEPKIVGKQIGLHPLIILICMFVGARMFGVIGIFILPIMVTLIKSLNDNGKINILK